MAMGALIGSLALGSALPHLIDGLWRLDWRAVLAAAAAVALTAAVIAGALVRPGPQFPSTMTLAAGHPQDGLARPKAL